MDVSNDQVELADQILFGQVECVPHALLMPSQAERSHPASVPLLHESNGPILMCVTHSLVWQNQRLMNAWHLHLWLRQSHVAAGLPGLVAVAWDTRS